MERHGNKKHVEQKGGDETCTSQQEITEAGGRWGGENSRNEQ